MRALTAARSIATMWRSTSCRCARSVFNVSPIRTDAGDDVQKDGPMSFADNRLFDNAVGVRVHNVRRAVACTLACCCCC